MRPPQLLRLYPRAWRERYGDELLSILDDRVRPRDAIDVLSGAASEWVIHMTGKGYWNDQAQRTTVAVAQSAAAVIVVQTFVSPIVGALIDGRLFAASTISHMLWGFLTSLLQSAVTFGPLAFVAAVIPWRDRPHARAAAAVVGGLIAYRIGSHVAWGPAELALLVGGLWIGYRTATVEVLHLEGTA